VATMWFAILVGAVQCVSVAAQEAGVSVDELDPKETCDSRRNHWRCLHREWVKPFEHNTTDGQKMSQKCSTGCGVLEGHKCCDLGCCAHPHGPTCVPFNLGTVHLVVVGDDTIAQEQHVTLPVGSTLLVACHPGFIVPPNKEYTNGEAPLSCTPGGAPYAHTELVCIPDPGSGHGIGAPPAPRKEAVAGTEGDLDTVSTRGNGAEHSIPDPEQSNHHDVGVAVTMLVMLGAVVATVVGKRKHQTSGGGASDRRRVDNSSWRSSNSTGSIGLRVAIGANSAEISLTSSLMSEAHDMGHDPDAEAGFDAPVVEASRFAPLDSSDQDCSSGTEGYTTGEEGAELELQSMVPEILRGYGDSMFKGADSR
jgi:hypothetical protein